MYLHKYQRKKLKLMITCLKNRNRVSSPVFLMHNSYYNTVIEFDSDAYLYRILTIYRERGLHQKDSIKIKISTENSNR